MSLTEGIAARDAAMAQGEKHANDDYKMAVLAAIEACAKQKQYFCSDDIADIMQYVTYTTHDKRVIGSMMRKAVKNGWCKALICKHCRSHVTRRTKVKGHHAAPMNYWESLIYSPIERAI